MRHNLFILALITTFVLCFITISDGVAQTEPNPTPIVIDLTASPPPSPTPDGGVTFTPPPPGSVTPDRFEVNDTAATATGIGFQPEPDLSLTAGDVDYFTLFVKAGQLVVISTAVYDGLDTEIFVYWAGSELAYNDDRSGADLGSLVTFQAPGDGWVYLLVQPVSPLSGRYDLTAMLAEPTPTNTSLPTVTPSPTMTPLPTMVPLPTATPVIPPDSAEPNNTQETAYPIVPDTSYALSMGEGDIDFFTFIAKAGNQYACETVTQEIDTLLTILVAGAALTGNDDRTSQRIDSYVTWQVEMEQAITIEVQARGGSTGAYTLTCSSVVPAPVAGPMPPVPIMVTPILSETAPISATETISETNLPAGAVSLTVRPLGPEIPPQPPVQQIRLIVYYDSNNDQNPSPGEGIPHVSVLAVDTHGQRIARVFTDLQGEAIFNTTADNIDRLVVPFVSAWSVRVQPGQPESLGLPAVRIPVFLPAASGE